jgi:Caspase domain
MVRIIVLLALMLLPAAVHAEARIALLIGNQSYDPTVGILKNPYNDIAVVGDALAKQGFEVLPPIKDAKRSGILGGVRDLVRRLNTAGAGAIGFIYYSGHGAAEKDTNINYLIPIDAKEPGTTTFWDESLKLDDVLRLLDGARSAAKFIVFDACRNELQLPTKDTSKGLLPVAEQQGMFIAYASAPGRTASDRGDHSGPYAAALASELGRPGLDHLNLFQNVKEAVLAATGGAQQPWESNGLGRRVYLTGLPASVQQQKGASPERPQGSEAERAWNSIKDTTNQSVLEAFARQFGETVYGAMAREKIGELKKQQVVMVAPTKASSSLTETKQSTTNPQPSTAIVAGHGIGPIMVGMDESQILQRLGNPDERSGFDDKTRYLNYFKKGLSIMLAGDKVRSIFAYSARQGRFGPSKYLRYQGAMDEGLTFDSSYDDIIRKLGVPEKSGAVGTDKWVSYKRGIGFDFNEAGKILHLVVTAPD